MNHDPWTLYKIHPAVHQAQGLDDLRDVLETQEELSINDLGTTLIKVIGEVLDERRTLAKALDRLAALTQHVGANAPATGPKKEPTPLQTPQQQHTPGLGERSLTGSDVVILADMISSYTPEPLHVSIDPESHEHVTAEVQIIEILLRTHGPVQTIIKLANELGFVCRPDRFGDTTTIRFTQR